MTEKLTLHYEHFIDNASRIESQYRYKTKGPNEETQGQGPTSNWTATGPIEEFTHAGWGSLLADIALNIYDRNKWSKERLVAQYFKDKDDITKIATALETCILSKRARILEVQLI